MAFAFESFVLVPDLSRIASRREREKNIRSRMPWLLAAELLYHFYRTPISQGTGYAVALYPEAAPPDFQRRYFSCLGLEGRPPTREDWLASLRGEPTEPLGDLFAACFSGRCVLGAALPPLFKKTLNVLNIPWIDIAPHPVRYLDNLLHAFSTNVPAVDALFERESLSSHYFEAAAAHEMARYAINVQHCDFWLPGPSALIVEPANDLPSFDAGEKEFFFTSAAGRLREACREYRRVFCASALTWERGRLSSLTGEEEKLLDSLGVIRLPDPRYEQFRNHYMLLAHPAVSRVIGRTEGDILEARLFGRECESLAHSPPGAAPARPIYETPFTSAFWHRVVAAFAAPKASAPPEDMRWPVPKLRLVMRDRGGFDDSLSLQQAVQTGELKREVRELQRFCHVQRIFTEQLPKFRKESAVAAGRLAAASSEGKEQASCAVFCAGDNAVTAQAVVALCSFRKNGVCGDLFYVTDVEALSEENRRLLALFDITPLHTRYADNFAISYLPTTPSAYNQFAGPGLLAARDYRHSLGVQADVLCIRYFDPRAVFAKTNVIAATHNNLTEKRASTYARPDELVNNYGSDGDILDTMRINPGVLFFHNVNCADNNIENKLVDIYNAISRENILLEEETVFNILMSLNPAYLTIIDPEYNCLTLHNFGNMLPYCLHFAWIYDKPWHILEYGKSIKYPTADYCKKMWHDAARDILGDTLYEAYIAPKIILM
ncbi:MAG: hypothetical protein LBQ63_01745 [Deltaproteobacteria bacterium]|nr:hypothetical protein [Deltaproteobacteria bacterium]